MASIRELHNQIVSKQRSAVEIATAAINAINHLENFSNPKLDGIGRKVNIHNLKKIVLCTYIN